MIVRVLTKWGGYALIVVGVLALMEVGVTMIWQEPVGAISAARGEGAARSQLRTLTAAPVPPAAPVRGPARTAARAAAQRRSAEEGAVVGELEIPRLDRRDVLIAGSSAASLRRGPGLYEGSPFPGERGTVAVAGHRTTHGAPFRQIDRLRRGDKIIVHMPYARIVYVVRHRVIVRPSDVRVLRGRPGRGRLVLSACHPLFSAEQRMVVIASPSTAVQS
jgi:sortase A